MRIGNTCVRIEVLYVLVALVLSGCHPSYDVALENRSDHEITIVFADRLTWDLDACSGRLVYASSLSPNREYPLQVRDGLNRLLYEAELGVTREQYREGWLFIRWPEEAEGCPQPIEGHYLFTIHNKTSETLPVILENRELGVLGPQESLSIQRMGSVAQAFALIRELEVPDVEGLNRVYGRDLALRPYTPDYNLGQVPESHIEIVQRWMRSE